jgi:multidrug resistance efflux pump
VRCLPLNVQSYPLTESFHGLLEAQARIDLSYQIPGRLQQLGPSRDQRLRENDCVTAGQIVAMLEPQRYEAAVRQAEARMEQAKAASAQAYAMMQDAQARLEDAERELARMRQLLATSAAPQREVDKAELAVRLAQAQLEREQAQIAAAAAAYESARAESQVANVNLQDATLRAPRDGVISWVPVEVGQMVQPGQTVMSIVDISSMKLVIGVVERKLPLLKAGQEVQVEIRALKRQAELLGHSDGLAVMRQGVISVVPPAADRVTGLFNVEIALPNDDDLLRPGMIGKATVTVGEVRAAAIPAEAVIPMGRQAAAFFVSDGYEVGMSLGAIGETRIAVPTTVARRVVFEPMALDKDFYLVTQIPPGTTRLIVEGHNRLEDGQTVRVLEDMNTTDQQRAHAGN